MEIKDMNMEQVEERLAAIPTELDSEGADVEALNAEVDQLIARKEAIKAEAAEKRALLEKIATKNITPVEKVDETRKEETMDIEIRNTPEYIEAYANYIKTGNDAECRALLTENVSGTVPVAAYVEGRVRTAWDREGIIRRVRKAYLKGNIKVGFEISATGATIHNEGVAVDEETVRLRSHIAQMRDMLSGGSPIGRKMDFLIQEFNREANTIGSKAQDVEIARRVVAIKAEIEKIREQIQNIE